MTPSEIEPATLRLAAQCLNQLRHCLPHSFPWMINFDEWTVYIFHIWWFIQSDNKN
jgi:hypothetical protein